MRSARPFRFSGAAALLLGAALAGCGDDTDDPTVVPDAGRQDTDPPELVSTDPLQGERGVAPEVEIALQFDEPMDTSAGSITVTPGGEVIAASGGRWSGDATRFIGVAAAPLAQGVAYELLIAGFTDAAGNPIEPATLAFETLDEQAPVVTASTPVQDADGLSARSLESLVITFSEPMDTDDGEADLQGGPRSLGAPAWSDDARTVTFEVDGLAYERDYELFLFGFRDRLGNLFDDTVYLEAGVLRFSTGADTEAPFVTSATPDDGQMGVNPARTQATISFVEAMDTSVRQATLRVGDDTVGTTVTGRWSADATRLVIDLPRLVQDEDYALDLAGRGYADAVGNALDPVPVLGDGVLQFSTGLDTFPPTITSTSFPEVDPVSPVDLAPLELTFNEAMDTSVNAFEATFLRGGAPDSVTLDGSWSDTGRTLTIDTAPIRAGFTYTIDLSALMDLAGNALDPTALEDAAFTLATTPPTGETCRDALTEAQATVVEGVTTWTLAAGAATVVDDGGETCDTTPGRDLVLTYEKTTESFSNGGTLLQIDLTAGVASNLEVATGSCDPGSEGFTSLRCNANATATQVRLDVGPGTYFLYVSPNLSSAAFPEMTVTVDELDEFPEGEACANPFDDTSAIYTAPATADDPHVWLIPEGSVAGYERGPDPDNDPIACGETDAFGPDAVLVFDKASETSVLELTVENLAVSTLDDLSVEVSTTCDPTTPGRAALACVPEVDGGADRVVITAPAGPVYVWLVRDDVDFFPQTRVSIREVAVAEGEACSRPKPLASTGSTSLVLDSGERFNAGGCFPATGNVTWYGYTAPASGYVAFTPNAAGALVLLDPNGGPLVCSNAAYPVVPATLARGQELCIGVSNDAATTAITVTESAYTGLSGTVSDPDFRRALSSTGSEVSWTSDGGMAVTSTTVYLTTTSDVFVIDKDGGERALEIDSDEGVSTSELGTALSAIGERLFTLETEATVSGNRVFRLWDGVSFPWDPTAWDTPVPTYPADDFEGFAYDGSDFVYASNDTTEAAFYRVSASRPSAPQAVGVLNTVIEDVVSLAADGTYLYYIGQADLPGAADLEGLFRIARSALSSGTAAPTPLLVGPNLAAMDAYSTASGPPLYLDDPEDPSYLYFRTMSPNAVHVIADPDGTPLYLGAIVQIGGSADFAMAYDYADPGLYLFETQTNANGRIVRID